MRTRLLAFLIGTSTLTACHAAVPNAKDSTTSQRPKSAPGDGPAPATSNASSAAEPQPSSQPIAATSERHAEKSEPPLRALPALCSPQSDGCAPLLAISAALDAGDGKEAVRLLAALGAVASEHEKGVRLYLRGRVELEGESLVYGHGGSGANKALSSFREAASLLQTPDLAVFGRARALLALGRGQEALVDLERLAAAYAGDAEVAAGLGIAHLSMGHLVESLAPLKRAVRLDPNEPERHLTLGTAHMLMGDLSQAERNFREALRLAPSSARAQGNLGSVLLVAGRVAEGRAHLARATELEPRAATYAANLSYAELLEKRPQEAKRVAERAIELDSGLAAGWLNLGLAEADLGNFKAAKQAFEKAALLDPTDPRPKNNLADLAELEGKRSGVTAPDDSKR